MLVCFSCLSREETMPPSQVSPAVTSPLTTSPVAPPARAGKRKLSDMETGEGYVDQRQSVLNMSMVKLHSTSHRRTEQSLRRSVLIYNTLKHIETELYTEGVPLHPAATKPCLLPGQPHPALTLDPRPEGAAASSPAPLRPAAATSDMDTSEPAPPAGQCSRPQDMAAMPPSVDSVRHGESEPPCSETPSCSPGDCGDARSILDSFFAATSRLNMASFASLFEQDTMAAANRGHQASLPTSCHGNNNNNNTAAAANSACQPRNNGVLGYSGSSNSSSSNNSEPDSLGDLDLAWLDFDLFTPLSSTVKLPSLSVEDLSHSLLPGGHDPILPLSATPSCNPKKDLLSEDLDHVMEILVGM